MLYSHTPCPDCHAGALGFRRCRDGFTLVLMCTECNAVWTNPDDVAPSAALYPSGPEYVIPGTNTSVGGGLAGWAARGEVDAAGWDRHISGEGTP